MFVDTFRNTCSFCQANIVKEPLVLYADSLEMRLAHALITGVGYFDMDLAGVTRHIHSIWREVYSRHRLSAMMKENEFVDRATIITEQFISKTNELTAQDHNLRQMVKDLITNLEIETLNAQRWQIDSQKAIKAQQDTRAQLADMRKKSANTQFAVVIVFCYGLLRGKCPWY